MRFSDGRVAGRTTVVAGESVTNSDQDVNQQADPLAGTAGMADLVTDSTNPEELQALLARARERIAFYEGFDRVIAENIRRSGELLLDTLAIRESVTANAARGYQKERTRVLSALSEVDARVDDIRAQLAELATQLAELRDSLSGPPPSNLQGSHPAGSPAPAVVVEQDASPAAEATTVDTVGPTRVIDVIAHHVPRAATALSLQRHLGDLDAVVGVEAREFAEGVLRMQVTTRQPLAGADLASWPGGQIRVLQHQPNVIEIDLA
jgi:hypothetical protein